MKRPERFADHLDSTCCKAIRPIAKKQQTGEHTLKLAAAAADRIWACKTGKDETDETDDAARYIKRGQISLFRRCSMDE